MVARGIVMMDASQPPVMIEELKINHCGNKIIKKKRKFLKKIMKQRDIKFRAWDGEKMHYDGNERIFDYHVYVGNKIMQYTGLKDKNGKEIYEGDILSVLDGDEQITGIEPTLVKVEFYGPWLSYITLRHGTRWSAEDVVGDIMDKDINAEIIGNIYENPNLIEP